MIKNTILGVSQVNSYVKLMFDGDANLKNVFISGEMSNCKANYSSGHLYFSLCEGDCVIKAVMFAENARYLKIKPEDGINVVVRGSVSSYPKSGQYQIYVDDLMPYGGAGTECEQIAKTKEKLQKEGLFDDKRKKNLPNLPSKIGVITSPSGAVIHDIKSVIDRRFPPCEIQVYPVMVQGKSSERSIIEAFEHFNSPQGKTDVIILARGGGAGEDLSIFNSEAVARKIAQSAIPVISAIGHDKDETICDFVADVRASTPSVAAELAVPDKKEIFYILSAYKEKIDSEIANIVEFKARQLEKLQNRLMNTMESVLLRYDSFLGNALNTLERLSPLNIISKGYAVVLCSGQRVTEPENIKENSEVQLFFSSGSVKFKVVNVVVSKTKS